MSTHTSPAGRLPHVLAFVRDGMWALELPVLAAICEFVTVHNAGVDLTPEEVQARIGTGPPRRDASRSGSVAVLPLHGVITPRADLMTEISGGTSVDRFRAGFHAALNDPDVSAIVLDVNSPGGSTRMMTEMAREIRAARGRKPIIANANASANSAAYWLASQADELTATDSASLGSIGVYAPHKDISELEAKAGVKTSLIHAGPRKLDGNPWQPLTDEARASIQERVDEEYATFVSDVAAGRGVPEEAVRDGYGQGAVLTARQALKAGMIDRIETIDQAVARAAQLGASADVAAAAFGGAPEPVAEVTVPADAEEITGAADRGPSFADLVGRTIDSAQAVVDAVHSLTDFQQREHLTGAKRDRLTACTGALREVTSELDQVLAVTNPDKHRTAALHERARAERLRFTSIGGQA